MELGRLNHVGVAVPDIDAAIMFWRDVMGATSITEPFDMPAQGVRVCFVDTPDGGTRAELRVAKPKPRDRAAFDVLIAQVSGMIEHNAQGLVPLLEAAAEAASAGDGVEVPASKGRFQSEPVTA